MEKPPPGAKAFNKVAVRLAGHRVFPLWAVLRHHGRRSGKPYTTPIAVMPTDDTFVIALPWGRGTDWLRNVQAAAGCTIRWKGVEWVCTEPEIVGREVAMDAARGMTRRMLQRRGPDDYLRLRRTAPTR